MTFIPTYDPASGCSQHTAEQIRQAAYSDLAAQADAQQDMSLHPLGDPQHGIPPNIFGLLTIRINSMDGATGVVRFNYYNNGWSQAEYPVVWANLHHIFPGCDTGITTKWSTGLPVGSMVGVARVSQAYDKYAQETLGLPALLPLSPKWPKGEGATDVPLGRRAVLESLQLAVAWMEGEKLREATLDVGDEQSGDVIGEKIAWRIAGARRASLPLTSAGAAKVDLPAGTMLDVFIVGAMARVKVYTRPLRIARNGYAAGQEVPLMEKSHAIELTRAALCDWSACELGRLGKPESLLFLTQAGARKLVDDAVLHDWAEYEPSESATLEETRRLNEANRARWERRG